MTHTPPDRPASIDASAVDPVAAAAAALQRAAALAQAGKRADAEAEAKLAERLVKTAAILADAQRRGPEDDASEGDANAELVRRLERLIAEAEREALDTSVAGRAATGPEPTAAKESAPPRQSATGEEDAGSEGTP